MASHIDIFTHLYENNCWGNNQQSDYKGSSGPGSKPENNKEFISFFREFIINNKIKTIVDLGCGDFLIGKELYADLDIQYTGYDAYEKVIETHRKSFNEPKYTFKHLDFCGKKEEIKEGDICILKDVLMHWDLMTLYKFMDYLVTSSKFKYILIVNCCDQIQDNPNITTGNHRPLSAHFFPLKRYSPIILLKYNTNKEVSIIKT